jgi:hypothetical protein
MAETQRGFLVLADISGFTAFVTATELEHGPPIIAELLEEVIRRISPPLQIEGIEGDAVFALGVDGRVLPPASLLDVMQAGFTGSARSSASSRRTRAAPATPAAASGGFA